MYTAEAGDSVSRIAARFYGTATKANRDLLVRANPPLQVEGNPVVIGKAYVIPNFPAAGVPAPLVARSPETPARDGAREAGFVWYTVKDNDSLWKIADQRLGNGSQWTTLRDLNKDVLKGGETVHPNMRIRVPAKPVLSASAN